MLSLYQAVDPPPEVVRAEIAAQASVVDFATNQQGLSLSQPPRQEFPPNSFVYTMCGIFGSCLTIISLFVISTIIWGQGLKSSRIPAVCNIAVYFLGLSGGARRSVLQRSCACLRHTSQDAA